jgi:peptidoglycan/LPS O-acetylase OafA/YrhL
VHQDRHTREHYLDVLRGAAALAVFVAHADASQLVDLGLGFKAKWFLGQLGVQLFFILSGYLIWISAKRQDVGTYAIHRVTRLVPLLWVNVAFCMWLLPLLPYAFEVTPSGTALWRHLTITQALAPQVSRDLNPVLWTLTHEALFYLLVPLLLRAKLLLVPLIGLGAYVAAWWWQVPLWPFQHVFALFTIGILLAERRPLLAFMMACVFTVLRLHDVEPYQAAVVPVAIAIMLAGMALPGRMLWLTKPLAWAGVISYSLYIWHYVLIGILAHQSGIRWLYSVMGEPYRNSLARGLFVTALVIAASTLSYWLIERPSMRQLRDWLMARRPSTNTQAVA